MLYDATGGAMAAGTVLTAACPLVYLFVNSTTQKVIVGFSSE